MAREVLAPQIVMLNVVWFVAVGLLVLWAASLSSPDTMGGFGHVLLGLAVAAMITRFVMGRRMQ